MEFHVDVRLTGGLAVLRIEGDLDLSTGDQLLNAVEQAVEQGCTVVAVDLSRVPFMDCAALGTLVRAVHRLGEVSGRLQVTAASPQVVRLLELTGTGAVVGLSAEPQVGVTASSAMSSRGMPCW